MLVFTAVGVHSPLKKVVKKTLVEGVEHHTLQEEEKEKKLLLRLKQKIFHPTHGDSFVPCRNNKTSIRISVVYLRRSGIFVS